MSEFGIEALAGKLAQKPAKTSTPQPIYFNIILTITELAEKLSEISVNQRFSDSITFTIYSKNTCLYLLC